jgi:predicted nucleic acid-binding protein
VKLLFDTSVWVEHLRHDALDRIFPGVRGRFVLWFDAVSAAELGPRAYFASTLRLTMLPAVS